MLLVYGHYNMFNYFSMDTVFRGGSRNLEIEGMGRHTRPKTPVARLICGRCQTTLETKFPYLLFLTWLSKIRNQEFALII